jgi:chromosome segregation ATPase
MREAWQGLAAQIGSGIPEGLPTVVVEAAHRFYGETKAYAREELAQYQAAAETREQHLKEALAQAQEDAAAAAAHLDHLQERVDAGVRDIAQLTEERDRLDKARAQAESQVRQRDTALDKSRADRAATLRRLRRAYRQTLAARDSEIARLKTAWATEIRRVDEQQLWWARQVDDTRQAAKAAAEKAQARETALSQQLESVQTRAVEQQKALSTLHGENRLIASDNQTQKQKIADLEAETGHQQVELASVRNERSIVEKKTNALRQKLVGMTARAEDLRKINKKLAAKNKK